MEYLPKTRITIQNARNPKYPVLGHSEYFGPVGYIPGGSGASGAGLSLQLRLSRSSVQSACLVHSPGTSLWKIPRTSSTHPCTEKPRAVNIEPNHATQWADQSAIAGSVEHVVQFEGSPNKRSDVFSLDSCAS